MLEIHGLTCGYGAVTAVRDISLSVRQGTIHGLIGPNGAGKTSLLLAVMGHVRRTAGQIRFNDVDLASLNPGGRTRLGISIVPEGRRLFRDLTVEENLAVGGYRLRTDALYRERNRVYELFPRLAERRHQVCGLMSGGEQQMVSFGRALMAQPKLLLVDELSLGLMPAVVSQFVDVIRELKNKGVTLLLVDQNTDRVLDLADDVTVLVSAEAVFQGSAQACRADADLFQRFLEGH